MEKYVRILSLVLAAVMLILACSCGTQKTPSVNEGNTNENEDQTPDKDDPNTDTNPSKEELMNDEFNKTWEETYRKDDVAPRPEFTKAEIVAQITAGEALIADIKAKASDLSCKEYTIPAGDYGFTYETQTVNGVHSAIWLDNIKRPNDNPFTINAEGVNFWFTTLGKPCGSVVRNLHLTNCENIIFKGLNIDSYTADDVEGSVTEIDMVNNRIAIKLYDGTMKIDAERIALILKGSECRIVPIKANGDAIVPLYNVDNTWGPGAMQISGMTPTLKPNEYWLTFKSTTFMNTAFSEQWEETYGKQGMLEVGDGISLLFAVQLLSVDNCKQITFDGLNMYLTKGGFWENGGYGNHTWKNCYFGPRKGTNQILGGEGNMSQGLRHGSTYDNITLGFTTDDAINIHGFWSYFSAIDGKTAKLGAAPVGISKGDIAEVISKSGTIVGTLTVAADPDPKYNYNGFLTSPITFEEDIPAEYRDYKLRWPASECDGWVIKNCRFENVYQRILVQSGSGTFENNKVIHMGQHLALVSNTGSYEGGVLGDITISNNVFLNCANHPSAVLIPITQTPDLKKIYKAGEIAVKDNVFVGCGTLLSSENIKKFTFTNNDLAIPVIYPAGSKIDLTRCFGDSSGADKTIVKGNRLFGVELEYKKLGGNTANPIDANMATKLYEYCDHSEYSAADIVKLINKKLDEITAK